MLNYFLAQNLRIFFSILEYATGQRKVNLGETLRVFLSISGSPNLLKQSKTNSHEIQETRKREKNNEQLAQKIIWNLFALYNYCQSCYTWEK